MFRPRSPIGCSTGGDLCHLMNDHLTRTLRILVHLQASGEMTTAEIAETLGTTPRTARRYLEKLREVGVRDRHSIMEDVHR